MSRKYFGTDGIRGLVGQAPITADFVLRLGWAAGKVLASASDGSRPKVLIGKDTRISGYMFESALEAGLVAAGVDVLLLGPMPTPAIAYLTRTFHAQAGIVISASHNPYYDNGIKFFSSQGSKLSDDIELAIEAMLDQPMTTSPSDQLGKVSRVTDAAGRYIEYCKSTVPMGTQFKNYKIVLDCAHGATYHVAPAVFDELGAEIVSIGVKPDGLNINEKVGSTSPGALQEAVLEHEADLGIAFDGDGDRVCFVDQLGEVVDGDEILFIIAAAQQQCPGVVGTLMSNLGFELALKERGIDFVRANVGDRYVMAEMNKTGWQLGGESSGHIICGDVSTTGDGIVAALQVMAAVVGSSRSLYELKNAMAKFPQTMINVKGVDKAALKTNQHVADAVAEAEQELADKGRVLLRPSGTEPVIRVMVEGEDGEQVQRLAESLSQVVKAALST
ncbi:Phosphoglucosamine mutase [Sinobacterium norvegicum]|uniref:Phosphoglucosamine mutase n=1 Tax=Sinobacterium norvegicum TaxID=1641715 RepID=A0ABN8EIP4_9GAMM|nr:phosphoglucosamine mutase [Sinobacterium norvegicum]CAH0992236.1 Phosphoglucosamine mutase [Sinobacterium norvegicum]